MIYPLPRLAGHRSGAGTQWSPAGKPAGWRAPEEEPLGRWLLRAALAGAALGRDAGSLCLQVGEGNRAAHLLYRRRGSTDHRGYHYRIAPTAG